MYTKPYVACKTILQNNLKSFGSTYDGPWLVLSDFNDITCVAKKFGGNKLCCKHVETFRQDIIVWNLLDLGFSGPHFTWSDLRQAKYGG